MKRKSSDLTEFYIQFLIVVYLLWSFPVLSFGQKEVLVPADGTVSEGEEQPVVALTFDDGPSGTSTPVLLEGLRKRGVRATFFVVGENVEKGENAQILREMSADGTAGRLILGQEDGAGACCCIDFGIRRNRGAYNKVTFWNWGLSV
ncbi:MAG: polysaccharide deacetylase family protein [Ruminococcus sp.]|nr:polysaccharide deacetylase family protein [Ruminococcus sp.]